MFHIMFVHYTFSSVWVAEWPPLGLIAARSVSNLFSLCFVYLQYLIISCFGFKSGICILVAPVPVHCFSISFTVIALTICHSDYHNISRSWLNIYP